MSNEKNKLNVSDLFSRRHLVGTLRRPHIASAIVSSFISITVIVLLALVMAVSGVINRNNIDDQCVDELEQTVEHLSEHVTSMIDSDKLYLEQLANIISISDYSEEEYMDLVDNFKKGQLIHKLNILLPDGTVIMRGHQTHYNELIKERFSNVVDRGYYISNKDIIFLDNTEGVYHSFPVIKEGKAIAVLVAFMDLHQLDMTFSALSWYDDTDQIFIVEAFSKKLILDTLNEEHGAIDNFFSIYNFGDNNNELISNIEIKEASTNVYTSVETNEDLFVCIMGVDVVDWVLIMIVPESKVLENLFAYNNTMNVSYVGAILLVAILVLNLILYNRQQITSTQKAYAKEHGERTLLDNVYSTIPTGILRVMYTPDKDEIVFANKAAATLLGYKSVESLMKAKYNGTVSTIYGEDKKKVLGECDKLVNVWDTVQIDARVVHPNGEVRQIRGHNTLIKND
ncbi:MAG: PAS domain-containing protein, partial [Acholeplasmatales bacterium]|nr:PAS domain-containing protein [Acholeplasmatales bacterium]